MFKKYQIKDMQRSLTNKGFPFPEKLKFSDLRGFTNNIPSKLKNSSRGKYLRPKE